MLRKQSFGKLRKRNATWIKLSCKFLKESEIFVLKIWNGFFFKKKKFLNDLNSFENDFRKEKGAT